MSYIFEVRDLDCAYTPHKVVLKVKELLIPFGKMVFFVGESGIGKSTILETLGMMNNTMIPSTNGKVRFKSTPEANGEEMTGLWKGNNEELLSQFRLKHFSFIFQQTNLMRNFTAYENIAITRMLQGYSREESISKTVEIIKDLKLDDDVNHSTEVFELSGGQQQRLAFARAIVPDFSVLFGDEPTGNLDPETAEVVMGLLRDKLKNSDLKTAIIVSHSFELATKFADIIVKIESVKDNNEVKKKYGYIDSNSVYTKSEDGLFWQSQEVSYTIDEMTKKLRNTVSNEN